MNLFGKLFDTHGSAVRAAGRTISRIHAFDLEMDKLKVRDFAKKTAELRDRYSNGESLDLLLPESFSLVREAANRTIGLAHYDEQLIAAIAFHQGKVAEQKTGEGKTLSATPALYLNALTGRGTRSEEHTSELQSP